MDDLWRRGLLGLQADPVTANQSLLAQAYRARQVNPRPQLEGYQAAQMAGMVPGLGLLGVLGDVQQYMEKPETRGILNYGLTALGALPFLGAMAKMAGNMPGGILRNQAGAIAYHGSPHSFDKFDMNKIGTGEGAQAYGHGLYFAENPSVAKQYAGMSKTHPVQPDAAHIAAAQDFIKHGMNPNEGLRKAYPKATVQEIEAAVIEARGGFSPNIYKVDLPDEQIGKMLDWDKPLSQQPPELLSAINKLFGYDYVKAAPSAKVQDLYSVMSMKFGGEKKAAEILKGLGIPGISYLDQGSRAAGQGTRNFVVFDDSLPKIVGRE